MNPTEQNLKKVYNATEFQKRKEVLKLMFLHLIIFLFFIIIWPIIWFMIFSSVLIFRKTLTPKSIDNWAIDFISAPKNAFTSDKNKSLN